MRIVQMSAAAGIELSSRNCTLVRVSRGRGGVRIRGFETLRWAPGEEASLVERLREARRRLKLPRRAGAVLWADGHAGDRRELLEQAGFVAVRVLSPADALVLSAGAARPETPGAIRACLAVNVDCAAIAVPDAFGDTVGRELTLAPAPPPASTRVELLQRYSLVARLAPEILQACRLAHASDKLDRIVTCGNLPDLRSLTMPLIEELDVEVETLDSLDGIDLRRSRPPADELRERIAGLRLSLAAAGMPAAIRVSEAPTVASSRWFLGGGAAVGVVMATALAIRYWPAAGGPVSASPQLQTAARPTPPERRLAPPAVPEPVGTSAASEATPARSEPPSPPPPPAAPVAAPVPAESAPPATATARREGSPQRRPRPAPSIEQERVPVVQSILVAGDRRLAVIDGVIVSVGDRVDHSVVVGIEADAVLLRGPSGRDRRVALREQGDSDR
jgi:hypothetical protein